MAIELLAQCAGDIGTRIERLKEEAERVVDEYWMQWRLKNKEMSSLAKAGEFLGGEVAPRITIRTGKYYIEWLRFRPGRVGNRSKSWGTRIKPTARGYTLEQLSKQTSGWEQTMVEETESRLRPIRKAMDVLHDCKVNLGRIQRAEAQQRIKLKEATND